MAARLSNWIPPIFYAFTKWYSGTVGQLLAA
jgi:hypothetical protein